MNSWMYRKGFTVEISDSILQKNREYSKLTEQALGPYVYDEIKIDPANGSLPRIVTSGTLRKNNFYTYYELDLVVVEFPV